MSAPPRLVRSGPEWATAFQHEAHSIAAGGSTALELHHIGSTAIPGIYAKPILDMLGIAPTARDRDAASVVLEELGYEAMGDFGIPGRRYFRRFDDTGVRTHHLHVFLAGSPEIDRHLAFRDYLRAHPDSAATYSDLKTRLVAAPSATWTSYMDGKDPFIAETEQIALRWAQTRGTTG